MLKITPQTLRTLYVLSQIPDPKTPMDGPLSPQGAFCLEHLGDGVLRFQAGDKRIQISSHLDVSGQASPWARRMDPKSLESLKDFEESGGSYSICTNSEKCLSLQKNFSPSSPDEPLFRYPLFCLGSGRFVTPPQPFPTGDIYQPVDLVSLKRALRVTAHNDYQNKANTVSFMEDSRCHGFRSCIHLQVSPVGVPFPIHLYVRDAVKVLDWLQTIPMVSPPAEGDAGDKLPAHGGVCQHEWNGHRFYCFRSPCGRHLLQVVGSTRSCQPGFNERFPVENPLSLSCMIGRRVLLNLANCLRCYSTQKLHFRIDPANQSQFLVDLVGPDWSESLGAHPFTLSGNDQPQPGLTFMVSPLEFHNLIKLHKKMLVRLNLFSTSKTLALHSRLDARDLPALDLQTVCRIRPVAPPEGNHAPAQPEQLMETVSPETVLA